TRPTHAAGRKYRERKTWPHEAERPTPHRTPVLAQSVRIPEVSGEDGMARQVRASRQTGSAVKVFRDESSADCGDCAVRPVWNEALMNKPAPKEPSMDEILSSIRQIIADDDASTAPPAAPLPAPAAQPA